jgi:hypothetical protein
MLSCNQNGNHLKEDLPKFGYKLNMKGLKKVPSIFFGYLQSSQCVTMLSQWHIND